MRKRHLIVLSLIVLSLAACGKDKPVDSTVAPIETIQPTEASTELNDPVAPTEELVIQEIIIGADGKQMTPEEAAAYEESIRTEDSLIETVPSETLSEQELSEASERDFTPEEYEQIQKSIDEWTYQEALERMGIQ